MVEKEFEISIVVCTYNRELYIESALNSLYNQSADKNKFEVIMVDNNSQDNSKDIAIKFQNEHPDLNFRIVDEFKQGLCFARNCGVTNSRGEIITFIDDDAIANSDFINNILRHFRDNEIVALGGKVIPIFPESEQEPKWISKYIDGIVSKMDMGEKKTFFTKKYPVGCNMSFKYEVFQEVGMFNTELFLRSDEKDLFIRLKKKSDKIMYAPDVVVEHVMSAKRVSKEGVIKVSRITGEGEYYRCKNSTFSYLLKLLEYLFKMGAALILAFFFLISGEKSKAQYLLLVRWYILIGYLRAKKMLNPDT